MPSFDYDPDGIRGGGSGGLGGCCTVVLVLIVAAAICGWYENRKENREYERRRAFERQRAALKRARYLATNQPLEAVSNSIPRVSETNFPARTSKYQAQ